MNPTPEGDSQLLDALLAHAAEVWQPVSGTFELTNRCNLACAMCYINEPGGSPVARAGELTAAQWVSLAEAATDAGMIFLLLTGGEPFLRTDFFDIYEPLTRMGLQIVLFTNATLITPEVAKRLAAAPPSRLEVSLYGATLETYERVTGVPGSYARCLAGIEALCAIGLPDFRLKSTLSALNKHEYDAMRTLAHRFGVPFSAAWMLSPRRDGSDPASDIRMALDDVMAIEQREVGPVCEKATTPEAAKTDPFYCHAGRNSFTVSATGEMNVCIDLTEPRARPLEEGFPTAWEKLKAFNASVAPSAVCSACALQEYCPSCPAQPYMAFGTYDDPVPRLCEIARARYHQHTTGASE